MFNEYIWARIAVISRVFGSSDCGSGLVPLSDMLNHKEDPGTEWSFIKNKKCFCIVSNKNFIKNGEIFDTYGGKCNSRYLVNYGFTLENNMRYNTAVLFFDIPKILKEIGQNNDNFLYNEKIEMLTKDNKIFNLDDGYSGYSLLIRDKKEQKINRNKNYRFQFSTLENKEKKGLFTKTHQIAYDMLSFIRIVVSEKYDWDNLKKLSKDYLILNLEKVNDVINVRNEILTLKILKNEIEKRCKEFKNSLEDDLKNIETKDKFSTDWNILNMLIGEKSVLHYFLNLCNNVLNNYNEKDEFNSKYKIGKILKNKNKFYYKYVWSKLKN